MRFTITLTLALLCSLLFSIANCVWAVPITGGTGPGGIGLTDGTSSLRMWLRSDTLSGPTIGSWTDDSGSGNTVTQGTPANEPDFFQTAAFNGLAAASFAAATAKRLTHTTFLGAEFGGQNSSMFTVYKNDSFPGNIHLGITTTGSAASEVDLYNATPGSRVNYNGDFRNTRLNGVLLGHPETGSHIKTVVSQQSGDSWELFSDGTSLHSTTQDWGLNTTFQIGASNHTSGFFNGEVAEVAIFNTALSAPQRQIIENALSSKFNVGATASGSNNTLGTSDRYAGDLDTNGDYDSEVFGIGQLDSVTFTSSGSAGFGIEAVSGLDTDGEFILAGHKVSSNSQLADRWDRTWYLDNQLGGNESLTLAFDWSDAGLGTADPDFLALHYSSSDGGPFSPIVLGSLLGDTVTFTGLTASELTNGYYTLGVTPPVPEPSSFLLLGLGVLGLVRHTRRRRSSRTSESHDESSCN